MSSDQEVNIVAQTRNKLVLDSQQQERRQQQQRQRLQQIQKRKQEKRRKREQAQRLQMEKIKQQEQKQKKYDQPQMMFQQDSDDGIQFKRVLKKIKRAYPQQVNKYQIPAKKKNDFIVPDNQDDYSDQSQQDSGDDSEQSSQQSHHKKAKKQKKIQKKQKKVQKKPVQKKKVQVQVKKQKVKIEAKSDRKQHLVKEVSIRWWYALPQWPPADFDYDGKLKQLGYRVLDAEKFKLEQDIVGGLQKCMAIDGYKGVYKTKTKLIDIRPKDSAPTLNNFRSKSIQELTQILRKALNVQIQQLKEVKYQQKGQSQLLLQLEKQLTRLK